MALMMPRLSVLSVLVVGVLAQTHGARANDSLILSCPVCHGSETSGTPTLRGHSADQIETLLRAYRDGSRKGTAMPRLAAAMSDVEIRRLADFYAGSQP